MTPRLRRWALFLAVQLLLAGVILEGGLRLARHWHGGLRAILYSPTVKTEYDSAGTTEELLERSMLGFHPFEPRGGYVLNARGFRTPEYAFEPDPGTSRVLILGDSFAFASGGVPWSLGWPAVLERRLDAELPEPVEVINLGVPAVGPAFELRLWELEGVRLEPDVVVLAFFVGNDFTDESGMDLQRTPDSRMARWSLAYRLVRNLGRLARQRARVGGLPSGSPAPAVPGEGRSRGGFEIPAYLEAYDDRAPLLDPEAFLQLEKGRLDLTAEDRRQEFVQLARRTEEILVRLHRSVRAHGARLVLLIIPDEVQVSPELFARVVESYGLDADDYDLTRPQRWLLDFCRREGLACLDLLPAMRARRSATGDPLYRPRNTHWNRAGNRLAGTALAAFLLEEVPGLPGEPGRTGGRGGAERELSAAGDGP